MFAELCDVVSTWAIPLILFWIPVIGVLRRVNVYEAFVEGASEGFQTALRIMPFLVAMMVAVTIFRASGAMDFLVGAAAPVLAHWGIPADLAPLAIMRPLSGSGSLGMVSEILGAFGPDSLTGRIASVMLGSTDTTFYILTVYFGAIGIRNPRYSVLVGLVGDVMGFLGAVYICRQIFAG